MRARMKNPAMIIPGAMEALQALAKSARQAGVSKRHSILSTCASARSMAAEFALTWAFASRRQTKQRNVCSR